MSARPAAVDLDRLLQLTRRLKGLPVAVIGDLVLDRYWVGRSSLISREALVLILEFEEPSIETLQESRVQGR